jgi:molecular chaperone Hsp33
MYKADKGFDLDELLDQLRGPYDIEVVREIDPKPFCPCSKDRMLATLATLPLKDLQELSSENKDLNVVCDFCRTNYTITPADMQEIIDERKKSS